MNPSLVRPQGHDFRMSGFQGQSLEIRVKQHVDFNTNRHDDGSRGLRHLELEEIHLYFRPQAGSAAAGLPVLPIICHFLLDCRFTCTAQDTAFLESVTFTINNIHAFQSSNLRTKSRFDPLQVSPSCS